MIRNSTAKIKDLIVHYYDKNHIFKKKNSKAEQLFVL